jgi:predicted site-specific integrase-resolvase
MPKPATDFKIPFKPFHKISDLAHWKGVRPETVRRWRKLGLLACVQDIGGYKIAHDEFVRVILHGISYPVANRRTSPHLY